MSGVVESIPINNRAKVPEFPKLSSEFFLRQENLDLYRDTIFLIFFFNLNT